jgi:hypothetical protein
MLPLKPLPSEFSTLSSRQPASAVSHLRQGYLITDFASAHACRIVKGREPTPCALGSLASVNGDEEPTVEPLDTLELVAHGRQTPIERR